MWCAWDFACLEAAVPMAGYGRIVSPAGALGNGIGGWFWRCWEVWRGSGVPRRVTQLNERFKALIGTLRNIDLAPRGTLTWPYEYH